MTRLLLSLLFGLSFFFTFALQEGEAKACSCGRASFAMHVKNADRVFLAKVGASTRTQTGHETQLKILLTIKGGKTKSFRWTRKEKAPLCGPSFVEGGVNVVFVKKGVLELCAGNFGMNAQMVGFPSVLRAGKIKTNSVSVDPMRFALSKALKGFLHHRKRIAVHYTPLRGKKITLGDSTLRFIPSVGLKKGKAKAVIVDQAIQTQEGKTVFSFISGRYPLEGLRFHVLLQENTKGLEILAMEISES